MKIIGANVTGSFILNGIDVTNTLQSSSIWSGSVASSINSLNAATASLNASTASLYNYTSSNTTNINTLFTASASLNTSVASLNVATASLYNYTSSNTMNVAALFAASASLNASVASLNTATASLNTATSSFSSSIGLLNVVNTSFSSSIGSLFNATASLNTATSSLNSSITSLNAATASLNSFTASQTVLNGTYATTGSNVFSGTQTITGSLFISQNLVVQGSSSIQNITASAVSIGTNTVLLNTDTPAVRFGGIKVYDSGSTGATGSLLWDSQNDKWIYQNASGSTYSGGMLISGPRNTGSLGEEVGLTNGKIVKGLGGDHIGDSIITESGTIISVAGSLLANSLTGSINGSQITDATVSNAKLANSTISGISLGSNLATLTIGTGLSGTSYNGSTGITIANTGVTSITAGTGISRDVSTGGVTITNTGVTSNVAGTGISINQGTGAVTITNSGVTSITAGTGISINQGTGGVTITNSINNTNQLTNGAGFITSAGTSADSNALNGLSAVQLYNNMGANHSTRTSFDSSSPSYGFGYRYVQGSTNGPGTGGSQFYSWYIGLGNDYPSTGAGSYGAMFAVDRNVTGPYLSVRYNESNTFTSWRRMNAGYADSTALTNAPTYNLPAVRVTSNGSTSAGASLALQQMTTEGWTGIFVDFEPYTGWGLYHDNPNNYFCVTAEGTTGGLRNFTVPSRESGNRTAYEKIRFDQNNGSILAGGDVTAFSDGRVKTEVKVIDKALEKVLAIRGVTFVRTDAEGEDKNKRHAGVIAQEVLEVLPEVVNMDKNTGMYNVAYGNMNALLIEAIKEQQTQIEELKTIINGLTK